MSKRRLDAELVRRGLAGSRGEARLFIEQGKVSVGGVPAGKPASLVDAAAPIGLEPVEDRFVSRGGDKLAGALARLDVEVSGRRWLDAGASTGGFTDCLVRSGAAAVVAVDVGYGQLHWRLRTDDRVVVVERTNVRRLAPGDLPWPPDGIAADLSFISLRTVMPVFAELARPQADLVLLVKPQFEVGRDALGRRGVVRDPALWRSAIAGVVEAASRCGLGLAGATPSFPPGPAGNREFFVHLNSSGGCGPEVVDAVVAEAARWA